MEKNLQNLGDIQVFNHREVFRFCEVRKQWGEFSNMSNAFPVEYRGAIYPTSEHLYISGLFEGHPIIQSDVLQHPNAMYCKRKFRSKAYKPYCRKDWNEVNVEWMKYVLNLKYNQNAGFRDLLEATEDKIILEDSTTHTGYDPYGGHPSFFWGAKDMARKFELKRRRAEERLLCKTLGLSKAEQKRRKDRLKESVYAEVRSEYIGANVMGLLLTSLRDHGKLDSIFNPNTSTWNEHIIQEGSAWKSNIKSMHC